MHHIAAQASGVGGEWKQCMLVVVLTRLGVPGAIARATGRRQGVRKVKGLSYRLL